MLVAAKRKVIRNGFTECFPYIAPVAMAKFQNSFGGEKKKGILMLSFWMASKHEKK